MKNFFIIFLLIFFCKIAFAEDQTLTEYVSEKLGIYFDKYEEEKHKYEEEKKENFISLGKIKELEESLDETNKNFEILAKEKSNLENTNKKLSEVKIIQINRSSGIIILSALLFLIFIILYLSLIISKQRKWRKEYFDENNNKFIGVLPERIADTIDKSEEAYNSLQESNRKQYDNFNQNLQQVANLINQVNSVNTENVSKINDQLSALRKFSDEKNELVKKYQEFYDFGILKSFVFEIISGIDNLEDSIKNLKSQNQPQSSIDAVNLAKDQLVVLLENENILQKEPDLQLKYNDPKQPIKLKVMKSIDVEDENLVGNIHKILHAGYAGQIGKNNEEKLIRESYVSIYISKKKEEN